MFYSAFSYRQFWSGQFQINEGGAPPVQMGGGGKVPYGESYWLQKHAFENEQRLKAEAKVNENKRLLELKRKEAEKRKRKLEEQRKRDIQEAALESALDALTKEILLLEQQNILLEIMIAQWIREEEEIYIMLLTIS